MEKSIKRVEKLVHVTNSALAQMKFSLMFDDMETGDGNGKVRNLKGFHPTFGEKFLDGDDLQHCQNEFKTEANEMLAKMESICPSNELLRKNSKAVDRIKEINRKMNSLKLEQSKPDETEQSRQKLLNLINEEKFSPGVTSSWDSVRSKRGGTHFVREKKTPEKVHSGPKKTDSLLTLAKSPNKSKEELKNKILETQDIVDRGFQTARQLAQKVETMSKCERKEKTPSTEKTVSEINLRSSEGKAESNESVSTVKCRKCSKERRRRRKVVEKVEHLNTRVIEIEGEELQRCRRSNLQLQRLPSLHIRGGLQLQKVHNLEIPAGGDAFSLKSNTAINFLSHEQMENEKIGEVIQKMRKENCCCTGDNPQGNYVECFNCGKLIRVRENCVDPRKVDEILEKCNFDVFDPRIDEFVQKCGTGAGVNWCTKLVERPDLTHVPDTPKVATPEVTSKETTRKKEEENPKKTSRKLQRLSDQIFKKYKEEAETMESNHEKLDSILQNLFRQVDESREVFENCHFFKNKKPTPPNLTVTKPVLVSLTDNPVKVRKKCRKTDKQLVNVINESRGDSPKNKMKLQKEDSRLLKSKEKEKTRRISLISVNRKEKKREEIQRTVVPVSSSHSSSEKLSEPGKLEQGDVSEVSSSNSKSWSSNRSKNASGKEDVEERRRMQYMHSKFYDQILQREKTVGTTGKNIQPPDVEKVEDEKAASDISSSSSSRKTGETNDRIQKPKTSEIFQNLLSKSNTDEMGKKALGTPSSKNEGKTSSETSSEKSENNYESDFESTTNEPNENVEECEDEEQEVKEGVNKLSTISEVDSELEQKVSDEQRTGRCSQNIKMDDSPKNTKKQERELLDQKEGNSVALEISSESKSKKTEATSPKTAEGSIKSTPTQLVTSLKDILTALQNQFVRTESLAEKLTENMKKEGTDPDGKAEPGVPLLGDVMLSSWKKPIGTGFVENLRSASKDTSRGPKSPVRRSEKTSERSKKTPEEKIFSADSLSDEGGSSLGEIIVSDRRRKTADKSNSSSISESSFLRLDSARKSARAPDFAFKLDENSEEVLYSEGEIPSEELLAFELFRTNSVGEVISEKN